MVDVELAGEAMVKAALGIAKGIAIVPIVAFVVASTCVAVSALISTDVDAFVLAAIVAV